MDKFSKILIILDVVLILVLIVYVGINKIPELGDYESVGTMGIIDIPSPQQINSSLRQYSNINVKGTTVIEFIEYVNVNNDCEQLPIRVTASDNSICSGDFSVIDLEAYYIITLEDSNNDGFYDKYSIQNENSNYEYFK